MSAPIVFISTHRIKEGKLHDIRELSREATPMLEKGKPETVLFQGYLNEEGNEVTFVHVFPDANAMDIHFQGAGERTGKAYEFIEPRHFEIYGTPSDQVLAAMAKEAGPGIDLLLKPQPLFGFIRLQSG